VENAIPEGWLICRGCPDFVLVFLYTDRVLLGTN